MASLRRWSRRSVTTLWELERVDIGFHRDQEFARGVRELAEDRLAADDHYVLRVGDCCRGPDDVLQLFAGHATSPLNCRYMAQRSLGSRMPENGVDWRSAVILSPSSTMVARMLSNG